MKVLFACVHNTGRSQMAEAFFRHLADPTLAQALSGGTEGAPEMNPTVVEAMRAVGIDLIAEGHHPKLVDLSLLGPGDRAISMGCGVELSCPAQLGPLEDWGLDDPKGRTWPEVCAIRDQVRAKVEALVAELGVGLGDQGPPRDLRVGANQPA